MGKSDPGPSIPTEDGDQDGDLFYLGGLVGSFYLVLIRIDNNKSPYELARIRLCYAPYGLPNTNKFKLNREYVPSITYSVPP
jgi:hypothetical protein